MTQTITPKKRIKSIDALRGFALLGILLLHCMENFDITYIPELSSPFWQQVDTFVVKSMSFLFAGKAYAIFSLLFGLSFFMQMDSQAAKGNDFRLRFLWRLILLFILGYLNNAVYMGEFFIVYAVLGIILIPFYNVPTKWLVPVMALLFLQIPDIVSFISLLSGNAPNEPTSIVLYMNELYEEAAPIFMRGSFAEVLKFNLWKGLVAKVLWVYNNSRYLQLVGLFILGMIIGRKGIHKNETTMVEYSRMVLPYSVAIFIIFYAVVILLPYLGVSGFALDKGITLFKTYSNLGMMMMYISWLTILYYNVRSTKWLDKMAAVGRMSVTNYMLQGFIGVPLFYGFGLNFAVNLTFFQSLMVGIVIYYVLMEFSDWWIKKYYYGPIEWVWRKLTWFRHVPLKRM